MIVPIFLLLLYILLYIYKWINAYICKLRPDAWVERMPARDSLIVHRQFDLIIFYLKCHVYCDSQQVLIKVMFVSKQMWRKLYFLLYDCNLQCFWYLYWCHAFEFSVSNTVSYQSKRNCTFSVKLSHFLSYNNKVVFHLRQIDS